MDSTMKNEKSLMEFFRFALSTLSVVGFLLGCSPESPKLISVPPVPPQEKVKDSSETVYYYPAVDILFVIDDSGSMAEKQTNLATNVGLFVTEIQKYSALDWHIGVVTSSVDGGWGSTAGDGKLVGATRFVDRNTPDIMGTLRQNLMVGIYGSAMEEFFTPIRLALTAPLVSGYNQGFYRPDAFLLTIFITDADDQSSMNAADLYKFMLDLKAQDKKKVLTSGVIIPAADNLCNRSGEEPPFKIEDFIKLSGGTQFGLCDADYGQKLADIGKLVVSRIGNTIPLSRAPRVDTIEVTFGTQIVPQSPVDGWLFDPSRNAIILSRGIVWSKQAPGTGVEVTFIPADLEEPKR
jgi:hypothetical protein